MYGGGTEVTKPEFEPRSYFDDALLQISFIAFVKNEVARTRRPKTLALEMYEVNIAQACLWSYV